MIATNANLNKWVTRLSEVDMPIFGSTVQSVVNVSENESANLQDLAQVILQDSSMTARVLKLVNSVYYNPSSQSINTISRAIALIGFDTVRAMCLSISLVDSLVRTGNRQNLIQEMSRGIHAAIQARNLAMHCGDKSPEEVFVATLLFHLGQMAFWCFADKEADQLQKMLALPGIEPEAAEQKTLGFKLADLTKGLAESWNLDNLLLEVVSDSRKHSTRSKVVVLSHKLASAAEKGWGAPKVSEVLSEITDLIKMPMEKLVPMVHEAARDAVSVATKYGASSAARIIPLPEIYNNAIEAETNGSSAGPSYNEPDPVLQLNILRELMEQITSSRPPLNSLLEMVLEGLHRGVGMDNALIALCSNDRRTLLAKYTVGSHRERLMSKFMVALNPQQPNVFLRCMESRQSIWVSKDVRRNQPELFNKNIENVVGSGEFVIAPLIVNGHPAGILYADRAASGRELDAEANNSFKLFATTATVAIDFIAQKRPARA